jgi:magnesium transporter
MADVEALDDDTVLDARRLTAILDAVEVGDTPRLTGLMAPLHAADIADLLEQISGSERRDLLDMWASEVDGDILSELDESIREEVIAHLPANVLADAMRELDTDDVVDILEDLEAPQQGLILDALEDVDRVAVQAAMAFPRILRRSPHAARGGGRAGTLDSGRNH